MQKRNMQKRRKKRQAKRKRREEESGYKEGEIEQVVEGKTRG